MLRRLKARLVRNRQPSNSSAPKSEGWLAAFLKRAHDAPDEFLTRAHQVDGDGGSIALLLMLLHKFFQAPERWAELIDIMAREF